ncbi:MAG: hypothetical protein GOMPHAMPRED_004475 [Gomphillus americanus]|uniref:MI domain-containing protein n=1 Tax=Gomphillus americanus TaxID=1940652 RepID=A0A8H3FPR3_9LECA|nr:MAG: hypothetical protein GOMPHAMPRED_004475 [Gomphillus americanus]
MPTNQGIKLPANILRELGIPDVSISRSKAFKSPTRKVGRKTSRIKKQQRPTSNFNRENLKRISQADHQASLNSDAESLDEPDEPDEQDQLPASKLELRPDSNLLRPKPKDVRQRASQEILQDMPTQPRISRKVREKLAEDDAEISMLERKLGLKRKKKLPKSFDEDGLGDLLVEINDSSDGDKREGHQSKKFSLSKDEEAWLKSKRYKAAFGDVNASSNQADSMDVSDLDEAIGGDHSGSSNSESDFTGFEEEKLEQGTVLKKRENPYVAPQTTTGEKYVPPSLRKLASRDTNGLDQMQRQVKGILNRLSEAKILSIVSEIEKMYRENPRQHVTTTLLDILFPLICDPSPLQDTFMILHGGFVAALYKTIGAEFGAQVIQRVVEEYDRISEIESDMRGKRLPNLMTFLAELYNFHVIGSPLIYDFIRGLTADLSEDNAELLLRLARISGSQLRQDDSSSLRDILTLLHASVETIGADNLSIRTKFMIETIENLKNNKVKTGIAASTVRSEHTTAMKKALSSIASFVVKASEPLRVGLEDIRNADKKGKWWIVGASFKDNIQELDTITQQQTKPDHPIPSLASSKEVDLEQLARGQGMNTEIRRAIFISLVSAYDHKEACSRLTKLGMKSKQRLEIPKVLVHCVGAEKTYYNRYYTKIAKHLCKERNLRKAFSFTLWDIMKRIEDAVEDEDEDDLVNQLDVTAMVYIGKMYGELVADGVQNILLLKHIDLAHPMAKPKLFAEVFLITIFQSLGSQSKDGADHIKQIFAATEQSPEMIAGLQLFLKKIIRKTNLVEDSKSRERVMSGCKIAEKALLELMSNGFSRRELSDLL